MASTSTDLVRNFHDRFCTDCGCLIREMTHERPLACPNELCHQPIPLCLTIRRNDGFFRCKRCYAITHSSFNFCESCGREKNFTDEARLMEPEEISRIIRAMDKNVSDSILYKDLSEETSISVVRRQKQRANSTPISNGKLWKSGSTWQGEQTGNGLEDSDIDELLGNLDLGFIENEILTPPKLLEKTEPVVELEKVQPVVKQKPSSKNPPPRSATGQFLKQAPGTAKYPTKTKKRERSKTMDMVIEAECHSLRKRKK